MRLDRLQLTGRIQPLRVCPRFYRYLDDPTRAVLARLARFGVNLTRRRSRFSGEADSPSRVVARRPNEEGRERACGKGEGRLVSGEAGREGERRVPLGGRAGVAEVGRGALEQSEHG